MGRKRLFLALTLIACFFCSSACAKFATDELDLTTPLSLADGGTQTSLSDPNADEILFWDDSEGASAWLSVAAPLTITGVTPQLELNTVGIGYGGTGQTTQQAALDAITDAAGKTSGYVLTTDGTNASWAFNASSLFTDSTTTTYLTATGDDFVLGGSAPVNSAKLSVTATDDQVPVSIVGANGSTANLLEAAVHGGSNVFRVEDDGTVVGSGSGASNISIGTVSLSNGSTGSGTIKILEDTDDGTNYTTIQTPALAGNVALTLPNDDGNAGEYLTTNGSGALDWTASEETHCFNYPASPVDTDDNKSIWMNDTSKTFTVTKLWCESDQTVTTMLQVDDGSPADMDTVDLVCVSTPDTDTSLDGDNTIASGDRVDVATTSTSGTPTYCTVCFTGSYS